MRKSVKSANPEIMGRNRQQLFDAVTHFSSRLIGEGDGQNALGRDRFGFHKPCDSVNEYAGFAAASARKHKH